MTIQTVPAFTWRAHEAGVDLHVPDPTGLTNGGAA